MEEGQKGPLKNWKLQKKATPQQKASMHRKVSNTIRDHTDLLMFFFSSGKMQALISKNKAIADLFSYL